MFKFRLFTSNDEPSSYTYWPFVFLFCEMDLAPPVECADFLGQSQVCNRETFLSVLDAGMIFAVHYNIPSGREFLHVFNVSC